MKSEQYTEKHALGGTEEKLPEIEVFPNAYVPQKGSQGFEPYEIKVDMPEFTSVCPKTGLPDFGLITIRYYPDEFVAELKALKFYMNAYRNLGIFQENVVNRVLRDFVKATQPLFCEVVGEFVPRGGLKTAVVARFGKEPLRSSSHPQFFYTGKD